MDTVCVTRGVPLLLFFNLTLSRTAKTTGICLRPPAIPPPSSPPVSTQFLLFLSDIKKKKKKTRFKENGPRKPSMSVLKTELSLSPGYSWGREKTGEGAGGLTQSTHTCGHRSSRLRRMGPKGRTPAPARTAGRTGLLASVLHKPHSPVPSHDRPARGSPGRGRTRARAKRWPGDPKED